MNLKFTDGFYFGLGFFVAGLVIFVLPLLLLLTLLMPMRAIVS